MRPARGEREGRGREEVWSVDSGEGGNRREVHEVERGSTALLVWRGGGRRRSRGGCGASDLNKKTRRRQRHRSVAADSPRSSLNPPVSAGTRLPPQQRPRRSRHGRPALSSAHAHAPAPPPTAQQLGRSRAVRPRHGRRIVPAVLHGSKCGRFRATNRLDSGFVTSSFFIHYVILLRYTRLTTVSSH